MAERGARPTHLVITAAVAAELPLNWLKTAGIPVYRTAALQAGAWAGDRKAGLPLGTVAVITGVGPERGEMAATAIRDKINPLYVLNVGSAAGATDQAGNWRQPARLVDGKGELDADDRLPIPWPVSLPLARGGVLKTVAEPHTEGVNAPDTFYDMEACAMARALTESDISFHALKYITDAGGADAEAQHQSALPLMCAQLQTVMTTLQSPHEADLSVIIPVHNRAERIVDCIESVLAQKPAPREVIVVDDGSDDGTAKQLKKFGDAVTVLRLEKNQGVSHARNHGAAHASGEWLAFLDSDDLWVARKLARQWSYIQRYPFYRILQSDEKWIRNGRRVNPKNYHGKPSGWVWDASLHRCLISPSAVVMHRDLFAASGGFDESMRACEDYDLWLRISRQTPVGLVPETDVIKHGGHDDQLSARYPAMDRFRIYALAKALQTETVESNRQRLREVLLKKLEILQQGSRKRKKDKETAAYAKLAASLEKGKIKLQEWQWCLAI
jgi:GT2 family glycosyltransferase